MGGSPGPSGLVDPGLENQAGTRAGWEDSAVVGVWMQAQGPAHSRSTGGRCPPLLGLDNVGSCTGFRELSGETMGKKGHGLGKA